MTRRFLFLLIFTLFSAIGAAWLYFFTGWGVPVLAYHKVSSDDSIYSIDPDLFDRQMEYLAENGYTSLSLDELKEGLAGKKPLPSRPIVITFDDGYEDNYSTALPILKKYGMRAAIFIAVDRVGQPGYLSWQQINILQSQGIDIGSHTVSHQALTTLGASEWQQEIKLSKAILDRHLTKPVTFLAYPHGKFTSNMFAFSKQTGYEGAFSGITGLNFRGSNTYELKRISILRSQFDLWSFRLRLVKANLYSLVTK